MFKDLMKQGKHLDMGFPIAEIESDGTVVITKEKNTGGNASNSVQSLYADIDRMCDRGYMHIPASI